MGKKFKTFFFSESSRHVVYQLKGKEQRAPCKHIFRLYTPSVPSVGSKCHIFFDESCHVAYQIKGMEHRAQCKHISVFTHTLSS